MDFVCWWQELELRAHDRYDALDQMSAELRQLREQRDALDALAEQELVELRAAALETCRAVEEDEAHAGSSLASRLRALGWHVSRRMCCALHLGVQKTLGVVRSHYEVNFEAVASGYVIPEGVEDEVAMEQVDALAADAAETLTEDFLEFLFPDAADADVPQA
jgi:hypothetical protein